MPSGTCGENLTWTLEDGTLTIRGTGCMYDYPISDYRSNFPSMKNIIIKNGVMSIGTWVFVGCESLISITIPDSVKTIGEGAFDYCTSLTSITIPDSVTAIGTAAFYVCKSLTSVTIPDSVTAIGDETFYGCKSLTSITIPASVTAIGDGAFAGCTSLTSITIPDSVTTIGEHAFHWCDSLTSVTIPDSVTNIGNRAFAGCENLKIIHCPAGRGFEEKLRVGNNAKIIPHTVGTLWWAVDDNTLIVGGVLEIKNYSAEKPPWFDKLSEVQKVFIDDGVKIISAHAFDNCPNLAEIELPTSVTDIGDLAFNFAFCGNRTVSDGKNIYWCLENGILVFKKNPSIENIDADLSMGDVSWQFIDKNITGFKLADGVLPNKTFFDWFIQRSNQRRFSLSEVN